jgi:hypothetical protein
MLAETVPIGADGATIKTLKLKSGPAIRKTFYSSAIAPVRPAKASRRYKLYEFEEYVQKERRRPLPFLWTGS